MRGDIKNNKGFSLIEMVIVMGIIAIFMLLGATALLSTRDYHVLDNVAEELVTSVREAQNNAVSVKKDVSRDTKGWAVSFETDGYRLLSLNNTGTAIVSNGSLRPFPTGITATTNYRNVAFMSPFGTAYLNNGSCTWVTAAARPLKDYYPQNTTCLATTEATLTLSFKGTTKVVKISQKGDIYVVQ